MRTPFLRRLLAGAVLPVLGACAGTGEPPRQLASIPPLELVGLMVQSDDGRRTMGFVEDVVVAPGNRPVQIIVASGAPLYPTKRRVTVDTGHLRYARQRQALMLTGMTPDQFATLPDRIGGPGAESLEPVSPGLATNWTRATAPR